MLIHACRFGQNADVDNAVAFQNIRRRLAEQRGVHGVGNVLDAQAEPRGVGGAHTEIDGRPGFGQAVERVHDAGNFFDFFLDARRGLFQPFQIGREQFDFDRVGRQLQIADHIGEDAGKSQRNAGNCSLKVWRNSAMTSSVECLRSRFSLTAKSPRYGFGDEHAHFRAEPARIAFHVRVRGQNLLRLVKLARGFGEARAGRRLVINDKTAFVEFGQKIGLQLPVNEHRRRPAPRRRPAT